MIDTACAGIADPAELFAVSLRISGRLGRTHPGLAEFLIGTGSASSTCRSAWRPGAP